MSARHLAVLVLVGLAAPLGAFAAGSAVVVQHVGDADPETEGFTRVVAGSAAYAETYIDEYGLPSDLGLYPVWAVDDPTVFASVFYSFAPTADQLADALAVGFRLRWWFRVVPGLGPIDPETQVAVLRFGGPLAPQYGLELLFGATASSAGGDLRMLAPDAPPEVVLPGGSVYHLVEAVYDPAGHSFDVFVDGSLAYADLPEPFIPKDSAFLFGGVESTAKGRVHHLLAELEIELPDCDDGLDNDGDGFSDLADPGCATPQTLSEVDDAGCNDGADNDGDGLVDLADPGCSGPADEIEFDFAAGGAGWLAEVSLGLEDATPGSIPDISLTRSSVARVQVAPSGTRFLGLTSFAGTTTGPGSTGGGIVSVRLAASLPSPTLAIASDGPVNAMPVRGERRFCLIAPDCSVAIHLPFDPTSKARLGSGGQWSPESTSSLDFTLRFAPWTLGTASGVVETPSGATLTTTRMGFAHGPLSATSTVTATSGVLQLVTPTQIEQVGLPPSRDVLFAKLRVRFVPEPVQALLLSAGAAAMCALAARRRRRPDQGADSSPD